MRIVIEIPFDGADRHVPGWAEEEERIDFLREHERAARCSMSFAAIELRDHLLRTIDSEIVFAATGSCAACDFRIRLETADVSSKDDSFSLGPLTDGVSVVGGGRAGTLYGAYEFLRMQGWRWFQPGPEGDMPPGKKTRLEVPREKKRFAPSFGLGRGFLMENLSKESTSLCLWMARNRMNIPGGRPGTAALCEKLGMSPACGGHIFAKILRPERVLPSGKSIWDEHPDWFGLPPNGVREKAKAQHTQFCVSQDSLVEFLGGELLWHLQNDWKNAERADIWSFDIWNSLCCCDKCKKLGNGADQTLYFLSRLRDIINKAVKDGALDRQIRMVMCSYEGTATLEPPTRPAPQNLLDAGDYMTFYPINRCYEHEFVSGCSWNRHYHDSLKGWLKAERMIPVMMGEYYNVSKFEDLPALFTDNIAKDIPAYHKMGVRGMTYMHLPMVNWGMRSLTQLLYAQLSWDAGSDVKAFIDEYFARSYGPHAEAMRNAYGMIERSWKNISQWRAWQKSILNVMLAWDGGRPEKDFPGDDHIPADKIVSEGSRSVESMREALGIIQDALVRERRSSGGPESGGNAVNPEEQQALEMKSSQIEKRLAEDRRLLLYGIDTMSLMTEVAAYYQALFRGDMAHGDKIWARMEALADKMDSYYMPIGFQSPGSGFGLISRDALTRSQLRDCMRRCRSRRS